MMRQLTFSATTEIDSTLNRAFLTLQETSGPGLNVRIGFDPAEMRGDYLMAVISALPEVVANYTEDVAREATDRGIL